MLYITYHFTFKNGIKEKYILEIEPHEIKESIENVRSINQGIKDYIGTNMGSTLSLNTTEGDVFISVDTLQCARVEGIEDLGRAVEKDE